MSRSSHLVLDRVRLRRGERLVFDDLSLALSEPRVALVGANGSGKSTLLRLAHGLALPDSGRVTTLGLETSRDRRLIPGRVGFLFQSPDRQILFPTVGEEVAFGFEDEATSRREALRLAAACLARHRRGDWLERGVDTLSDGEKQLACLIAVTAREPGLLLLDEPFASLDLAARAAFSRRLVQLGIPLVMASHDLDLVADFDRVVWLDAGAVRQDGRPQDVLPAFRAEMLRRGDGGEP
ncbi:MAG: ABC transporter ATP-binding protein [Alsobacter sp.]